MKRFILLLIIVKVFINTGLVKAQSPDLNQLAQWLTGQFSSREQHLKDSTNYFDIRLSVTPIWKHRMDGYWLYVEQAVHGYESRPYRQRIYHVSDAPDGMMESRIYTLPDPLRFAQQPEKVNALSTDSISLKAGCSVFLRKDNEGFFTGSTRAKDCLSDRNGARYTVSEVMISADKMISWDKGFNERDEQVWGAELGGYIFIREK